MTKGKIEDREKIQEITEDEDRILFFSEWVDHRRVPVYLYVNVTILNTIIMIVL